MSAEALAALEAEVRAVREGSANMSRRLDKQFETIDRRLSKVEESVHSFEVSELRQTQDLKDLISEAVEIGSSKMMSTIDDIHERTVDILQEHAERIKILEDNEAKKELETLQQKERERREMRKHWVRLILGCIITLVAGQIFNNVILIVSKALAMS